jgi:ribosome-associated protein
MGAIRINRRVSLDEDEVRLAFVRSGGPGGQNVNKVATAVQLRFDVAGSRSLPEDVRERLMGLARGRINDRGELVMDGRRFRSQERNRADVMEKFADLVRRACVKPKARRRTSPTAASRRRRLENKKRRGETKHLRRSVGPAEQ